MLLLLFCFAQDADLDSLIEALRSDDIDQRAAAQEALQSLPHTTLPALRQHHKKEADSEVLGRLQVAIRSILPRTASELWKQGQVKAGIRLLAEADGAREVASHIKEKTARLQSRMQDVLAVRESTGISHYGLMTIPKLEDFSRMLQTEKLWVLYVLFEALKDRINDRVRRRCFLLLSDWGTDMTLFAIPYLRNEDPFVRSNVAILLGNLKDRRALPALMKLYRDPEERSEVKVVVAEAIEKTTRMPIERAMSDKAATKDK